MIEPGMYDPKESRRKCLDAIYQLIENVCNREGVSNRPMVQTDARGTTVFGRSIDRIAEDLEDKIIQGELRGITLDDIKKMDGSRDLYALTHLHPGARGPGGHKDFMKWVREKNDEKRAKMANLKNAGYVGQGNTKVPTCPEHNITMPYDPADNVWRCPANGCTKVARKRRNVDDFLPAESIIDGEPVQLVVVGSEWYIRLINRDVSIRIDQLSIKGQPLDLMTDRSDGNDVQATISLVFTDVKIFPSSGE